MEKTSRTIIFRYLELGYRITGQTWIDYTLENCNGRRESMISVVKDMASIFDIEKSVCFEFFQEWVDQQTAGIDG